MGMAITLKSTYSLDIHSVRALESLARRWGVSKSEALRRTIRAAADGQAAAPGDSAAAAAPGDSAAALDVLQQSLKLTAHAADEWRRRARTERRATKRAG